MGLAVDVKVRREPRDAGLVRQGRIALQVGSGLQDRANAGPCPMPQTAPPAKPAPTSATDRKVDAGTSLTLGAPWMSTNWISR